MAHFQSPGGLDGVYRVYRIDVNPENPVNPVYIFFFRVITDE
jgi:hypothetical protein